jgi:hypothetical protein
MCTCSGVHGTCDNVQWLTRRDFEWAIQGENYNTPFRQGNDSFADRIGNPRFWSSTVDLFKPLLTSETPAWAFETLVRAGQFSEAASFALAVSDWKNFLLLTCASYSLASSGRANNNGDCDHDHKVQKR